jgi:phosphate acetyltransferase
MQVEDTGINPRAALSPLPHAPGSKYDRLIERAKSVPAATTLVVHPCDETSLRGATEAAEAGIIQPILVGPTRKITNAAREHAIDISRFELIDAPHSEAAAAKAVQLVHEAKGELLMKGSLHTDELMRAVTSSATGLRTARRINAGDAELVLPASGQ